MPKLEHTHYLTRRILFNSSNVRIGGGLQAALATIREALNERSCDDWHFALSRELRDLLIDERTALASRSTIIEPGPARSRSGRQQILRLASSLRPEAIFTFVGPTHVRFSEPHLMGLNNPWLTGDLREALSHIPSPRTKVWLWAWTLYTRRLARHADTWVTQTAASKRGIARLLNVPSDKICVVPNTPSERYRVPGEQSSAPSVEVRILCFGAPHPHKRFPFCADVASKLQKMDPDLNFKFLVTIPTDSPEWQLLKDRATKFGVISSFENRGFIPPDQGPDLYRESSLVFLPTVMECFSATYPEAMAMSRPIVTSDRDFARSVCGSAALYFDPKDADQAANAIIRVSRDPQLRALLIKRGHKVLETLPTPNQRLGLYLNAIEDLLNRMRNR